MVRVGVGVRVRVGVGVRVRVRVRLPDLEVASVVGVERLELLDGDRRLEAELREGEHAGDLVRVGVGVGVGVRVRTA